MIGVNVAWPDIYIKEYMIRGIHKTIPAWTQSKNLAAAAEAFSLKISSYIIFLK